MSSISNASPPSTSPSSSSSPSSAPAPVPVTSTTTSKENPTMSLVWFIIITVLYFVFKYTSPVSKVYGIIYVLLLIVGEFVINLNLTKSMCGNNQYGAATFITILPWVFILGILNIVLTLFPGWLSPFSNTFGYLIAKLFGLNRFFNDLLKLPTDSDIKDNKISQSLADIYNDQSALINKISPTNLDTFWKISQEIIRKEEYTEDNKNKLLNFLNLKNIVSEFIWYLLTGILITSVSYNYLLNRPCTQDAKIMKQKRQAYEETIAAQRVAAQQNSPRVYSTYE